MQEAELGKNNRAGRPRKTGERYPGGKLKPREEDPRFLVMAKRMAEHTIGTLTDARMGAVIGRMRLKRLLTDAEFAAGMKYAEIVGRYERLTGMPERSAASPSYQRGYGSFAGSANMTVSEAERRVKRARKEYLRLQNKLHPSMRDLVERACCDDREIAESQVDAFKVFLNALAHRFRFLRGKMPTQTWHAPGARPTGTEVRQEEPS